ncbi:integral membrane sensor signal transduction histidine kinase [Caldalkalibacillus thermarum TA2.A1]|nr:integral membrane sensor signal transduction histidine kinase [Caldalkalibacillus thermarum TA2.A1]
MKNKLSRKITLFVLIILLVVITVMITSVYAITKSFFKTHLVDEIEHRIISHSRAIESRFDLDTIEHVLKMERKDTVQLILFDDTITPLVASGDVEDDELQDYVEWINQARFNHTFPVTHFIENSGTFHMPHIWSIYPIKVEGDTKGYLFIDQDTSEFEQASIKLFLLLLLMGVSAFIIGLLFTLYLTKKISRPLHDMGKVTNQIARGKLDTNLDVYGDDEVGKLADDIRSMARQLKEYRDSRQQFLSYVSHDLRTPITYIKGYSAIMKDATEINEKEWRRHLEVIYREASRMEFLVKDLFQLTQMEEGKISLHKERVEAVSWLQTIVENKQLMFDHQSITYDIHYKEKDKILWIDKERMAQVINNLLENSLRYTGPGGRISLSVYTEDHFDVIEVKDTGIGIPEEDLPYIWDRFYRVDKSRTSKSGGSGLGLAIVKEIITLHGGHIEVDSKVGQGTTFKIYLKPVSSEASE